MFRWLPSSLRSTCVTLARMVPRWRASFIPSGLAFVAVPPFALERLSVSRGPDGRIARIRYVLPRHKAANRLWPNSLLDRMDAIAGA